VILAGAETVMEARSAGVVDVVEQLGEDLDDVLELEDLGGRTKMVLTHVAIPSDAPGAAARTMAPDRLAAHVEHAPSQNDRP
jgi:hypothetical protein